jgi:hypothetical protein
MAFRARWHWQRCHVAPPKTGPARSAQAGVIVGDDVFDAAQERAPVHLRLGQGDRDAQHPATLVGADADRREHGGVAHDPAVAHLLVTRIEDPIPDLAEGPVAPGLQLVVEQRRRAADLRDRLSMPNARITAFAIVLETMAHNGSTSRVDTPLTDISATASVTARTDRRPRSGDCG